jgi:hypothetical protein
LLPAQLILVTTLEGDVGLLFEEEVELDSEEPDEEFNEDEC